MAVESGLVAAARSGDEDAFAALVAPYWRALHLHCYRLLGSYHDAQDATQEVMLRAWRSLHTFQGRAPLRAWLYRIATTTCLKVLEAPDRRQARIGPEDEVTHLQPYPDRLLDELTDASGDPAAIAEQRESVALAFVAAVQRLPARQRAVLILRDVLEWSAAEVADLLETSVAAVNSALQRARQSLAKPVSGDRSPSTLSASADENELVRRFVSAWERRDITALAALLREDAVLHMPPILVRISGRQEIADFFASVPATGHLDWIRLVPTRANGQPTLAAYIQGEDGSWDAYGLMVLTLSGNLIQRITGFPDPTMFEPFGLVTAPQSLPLQRPE